MAEDETVPLLPSLEEEFDEDSGVASKVTQVGTEQGRTYHSPKMVVIIFVVVGLTAVLVIGAVLGITIPLVQRANRHDQSGGTTRVSSTLPIQSSSSSSSANSTQPALYSSDFHGTTAHSFRTMTTIPTTLNPTPHSRSATASHASSVFSLSTSPLDSVSYTHLTLPTIYSV